MKEEIKNECYLLSLEGLQNKDIAKRLNLSPGTVSKAIKSIEQGNDYQLAVRSCGVLTSLYVRYQDFIKKKMSELEQIKPDDNMEKIALIKLGNELFKDMVTIGANGDFIQNVRKIRDRLNEIESGSDVPKS